MIVGKGDLNFHAPFMTWPCYKFDNVISYSYIPDQCEFSIFLDESERHTNETEYYFVMDCNGTTAFAHWVFESLVFFQMYNELVEAYPSSKMKIMTTNTRMYVRNFLSFLGIDDAVVVHQIDPERQNHCFFHPIISMSDKEIDVDFFEKVVLAFRDRIRYRLVVFPQLHTPILIFPRDTIENYPPNDRIIPLNQEIQDKIIEMGGTCIQTFPLNNFHIQFNLVMNTDIFVCVFGSAFLVNCIFLENKIIHVRDDYNMTSHHAGVYPSYSTLYNLIQSKNIVNIASTSSIILSI